MTIELFSLQIFYLVLDVIVDDYGSKLGRILGRRRQSIEAGDKLEDAFFGEEEDVEGFIFLLPTR